MEEVPGLKPWVANLESKNLKYHSSLEAQGQPVDFYKSFLWVFEEKGRHHFEALQATAALQERDEQLRRKSIAVRTLTGQVTTLEMRLVVEQETSAAKDAELRCMRRGISGWVARAKRAEAELGRLGEAAAEKDAELGRQASTIEVLEARCHAAEEEVHRRREAGAEVERLAELLEEKEAEVGRRKDNLMSTLHRCTAAEAEAVMLRTEKAQDLKTIKDLSESWWASAEDFRRAKVCAVGMYEITEKLEVTISQLQQENLELKQQVAAQDAGFPTSAALIPSRRCWSAPAAKGTAKGLQERRSAPSTDVLSPVPGSEHHSSGEDRIAAFRPSHLGHGTAAAEQQGPFSAPAMMDSGWDSPPFEGLPLGSAATQSGSIQSNMGTIDERHAGCSVETATSPQLDRHIPISFLDPLWGPEDDYGCEEEDYSDYGWASHIRGGRVVRDPKGTINVGGYLEWEKDVMQW